MVEMGELLRAANDSGAHRRPGRFLRRVLRVPVALYRARLGFLLGHRFLLLVHTGRRSGCRYETVLEVMRFDPRNGEAVVISGFGRRASWFRNVESGSPCEVLISAESFVAAHRVLPVTEAEKIIADYERRNRLAAPLVRAVLCRLAGVEYDSSPAARARVVAVLPLVAFRPRN
jgi:deazaflavin-dependent oxidoreductase (nitroreductase family)